jgi:hypothetical protein
MRLSNRNRTRRNKCKTTVFILLPIVILISISLSGCTYKTYTGNIGDATFSFRYRKNDCVKPYNPYAEFSESHPIPPTGVTEGCSSSDSHINIYIYGKRGLTNDAEISLELFLANLSGNEYLRDLEVIERDTIIIAGITAEYVNYYYEGYKTEPVGYEGKFISFAYGDYIVDIDVLFPMGNLDTDIAFDLLVETFKIRE